MDEVYMLLWEGAKARSMVATDMYTYSSHAHSAFIVKVRVDLEDSHVVREE